MWIFGEAKEAKTGRTKMRCQGSSYKSSPRPSLLRYIRYLRSLGVPFLTIFQINPLPDPKSNLTSYPELDLKAPLKGAIQFFWTETKKVSEQYCFFHFDMARRVKSKKNLFLAKAVRCQEEYSSKDSFTKLLVVEKILVMLLCTLSHFQR